MTSRTEAPFLVAALRRCQATTLHRALVPQNALPRLRTLCATSGRDDMLADSSGRFWTAKGELLWDGLEN
ncbi:hypothetical protein [Streptomyces sp. NPDC017529]|uniref:hypothetical protein n=1 Tax=Streptomyces sp. NPDC017529 TaxID=3365000 RepID=UPI00378C0EF8